jgi:hypothetical protein
MELTTPEARIKGQERVFARILMISFRPRYRKHEAKISVTSSGLGGGARIASRPPSGRTRNRQASGRCSNPTASFVRPTDVAAPRHSKSDRWNARCRKHE